MSKLGKFLGQPKEVEIKGEKMTLFPLKVKDLVLFKENMTAEEKMKLGGKLIKRSLNDDSITDEEVESMDLEVYVALMDEINKINGFEDGRITKIKESIISRAK